VEFVVSISNIGINSKSFPLPVHIRTRNLPRFSVTFNAGWQYNR